MKRILLILLIVSGYTGIINAQSLLNAGLGYYMEEDSRFGMVAEFEYEKFHSKSFSTPLRVDVSYLATQDYNSMSIEIHQGFREYISPGFFVEQSIGLGIIANIYTVESIWYYDTFEYAGRYYDNLNPGLCPSVTLGVGYNLTHKKGTSNLLWIRPKVYMNMSLNMLNAPVFSLQMGFTHNFKTKK